MLDIYPFNVIDIITQSMLRGTERESFMTVQFDKHA